LFDWRAIFAFQAPVAVVALVATLGSRLQPEAAPTQRVRVAVNLSLGFIFGALVGALFPGVLLVITVWGLSSIGKLYP
jgi:hypothetical protein